MALDEARVCLGPAALRTRHTAEPDQRVGALIRDWLTAPAAPAARASGVGQAGDQHQDQRDRAGPGGSSRHHHEREGARGLVEPALLTQGLGVPEQHVGIAGMVLREAGQRRDAKVAKAVAIGRIG